ncbi:MAG: hypothetical protein HXY41_07605 [Chloroflexi bacterium]|nr:hypothetical protein [Chloroflexota bacterium]
MPDEIHTEELVATENYIIWISHEPDGETSFHIELGQVTAHLFREEWDELLALMAARAGDPDASLESDNMAISTPEAGDEDEFYYLELAQATLNFLPEDWQEFTALIQAARDELANRP